MSRVAFLLFLIAVGLCWLLPLPQAHAANQAYMVQACAEQDDNNHPQSSITIFCTNVQAGNTIIVDVQIFATTPTITATESVTCPAAAKSTNGSNGHSIQTCYVLLASSHSIFSIQLSVTGGSNESATIVGEEWQGVGAIDSAASTASTTATNTISVTTAATNELVHANCGGYMQDVHPASSFAQKVLTYPDEVGGAANWKFLSEILFQPSATTFTASCTFSTPSSPDEAISVVAFAQSSPPAPPAVQIVQWCFQTATTNGSQGQCELNNTTSGNKIVFSYVAFAGGTFVANGSCSPEACTVPANSQTVNSYSPHFVGTGIGYTDTTAGHTTFTIGTGTASGASHTTQQLIGIEISGLQTGIDAGSEAAAVATTVAYTTAAAQEFTFCTASDTYTAGMTPGNSFGANGEAVAPAGPFQPYPSAQSASWVKVTSSSGSNTCSYTQTGTTTPEIATASFVQNLQSVSRSRGFVF